MANSKDRMCAKAHVRRVILDGTSIDINSDLILLKSGAFSVRLPSPIKTGSMKKAKPKKAEKKIAALSWCR